MAHPNERWPHPSVVAKELATLRAEKAIAEWKTKQAFMDNLAFNLGMPLTRIRRRRVMEEFTQRMLKIGERIMHEQSETNSAFWD
jgi:hypothetical protein